MEDQKPEVPLSYTDKEMIKEALCAALASEYGRDMKLEAKDLIEAFRLVNAA